MEASFTLFDIRLISTWANVELGIDCDIPVMLIALNPYRTHKQMAVSLGCSAKHIQYQLAIVQLVTCDPREDFCSIDRIRTIPAGQ